MTGRPTAQEAAPYYFTYIDQIPSAEIVPVLESQLEETLAVFRGVSNERSLYRYAPGKWSIRELLNHVNDTERVFALRACWFARGLPEAMPSFDQDIAARHSGADGVSWQAHIEEFRGVRLSTISLFRNLPEEAWMRKGIASGNEVTVRALAYIVAGHVAHHLKGFRERYF